MTGDDQYLGTGAWRVPKPTKVRVSMTLGPRAAALTSRITASASRLPSAAVLLFVAVVFGASTGAAQAVPVYSLTELPTLGSDTYAFSINSSGQVSGWSTGPQYQQAFVYSGGSMTAIPRLGPGVVWGFGINDLGQSVGQSFVAYAQDGGRGIYHAFLWTGTSVIDLGTLPGGDNSSAVAINNAGQIVGSSNSGSNMQGLHAVLYSNGLISDLGTLGGNYSQAQGINDQGHVVGVSSLDPTSAASVHAFLYANDVMTDLGTLDTAARTFSNAYAINDHDQVVGGSYITATGSNTAFLWSNGVMTDLGSTPDSLGSYAYGINNEGDVVGTTQGSPTGIGHALLWEDGLVYDLNTLLDSSGAGWILENAFDINDSGQIVGHGIDPSGQKRAFLLNPVPEPTSVALVLMALGAVAVASRWRPR